MKTSFEVPNAQKVGKYLEKQLLRIFLSGAKFGLLYFYTK